VTAEEADLVRGLLARGATRRTIAAATGVSRSTISAIAHNKWSGSGRRGPRPAEAMLSEPEPDCRGRGCESCVACRAGMIPPGELAAPEGPLPQDPSPEEIRQRCREVLRSGGGRLVLPEIADPADLLEPYAANVRIDRNEEDDDAGSTEYCVADLMSSLEG
jgi:transcriptional regulator with XRE-family HTH domain